MQCLLCSFQITLAMDEHGRDVARPQGGYPFGVGFRCPQPAGVSAVAEPGFGDRQHGSAAAWGRRGG